jgi:tetratricopeptide (TPR) repeat protein
MPTVLELIKKGREYRKSGHFQEAEASYRQAIEIAPETPHPYYELAVLLETRMGDKPEIIRRYEKFVELAASMPKLAPQLENAKKRLQELKTVNSPSSKATSPVAPPITHKTGAKSPVENNTTTRTPMNLKLKERFLSAIGFAILALISQFIFYTLLYGRSSFGDAIHLMAIDRVTFLTLAFSWGIAGWIAGASRTAKRITLGYCLLAFVLVQIVWSR